MTTGYVTHKVEEMQARRRDRRRALSAGIALVGTMMALMLLLALVLVGFVASATGGQAPGSENGSVAGASRQAVFSAGQRVERSLAVNAAETGIWATMQWLNEQSAPPNDSSPFRPSSGARPFVPDLPAAWKQFPGPSPYQTWDQIRLPDGSITRVKVYPYEENDTLPQRSYVIEAIGEYKGRTAILRGVARQDTFAKYAFFANDMPTNFYVSGLTAFNGPVHFNGIPPTGNTAQKLNILYKSGQTPEADGTYAKAIFRFEDAGSLTCAFDNDRINWFRDTGPSPDPNVPPPPSNPPATDEEWKMVALKGRTSIQLGVNKVDMPSVSTRQRDAALNGATAPAAKGVHLPGGVEGGIFIQGDVDDMVLQARNAPGGGADNLQEQRIEIFQSGMPNPSGGPNTRCRTVIIIDPVANTTRIERSYPATTNNTNWQAPASTQDFVGTPNGVVYANGHIGAQNLTNENDTTGNRGGLSGTVARGIKLNIVTDATKNLNIDGSVTLAGGSYEVGGVTYPYPGAGILGLVSNNVQIVTRDNYTSTATPTDLDIHATIMAYGSMRSVDPDNRDSGSLTRLGGTIVGRAGRLGEFNLDTLALLNGFSTVNNYDDRMINDPPPHFPSTGNVYVLVSLERVRQPLQN